MFLTSVIIFNFMFPSEFEWHDDNDAEIGIEDGLTVTVPRASVDHLGPSFMMSLVAAQMSFLATLSVYFSFPRVSFD